MTKGLANVPGEAFFASFLEVHRTGIGLELPRVSALEGLRKLILDCAIGLVTTPCSRAGYGTAKRVGGSTAAEAYWSICVFRHVCSSALEGPGVVNCGANAVWAATM